MSFIILNMNILYSRGRHKDSIGVIPVDGRIVDIPFKLYRGRLQLVNTKPIATGIYQCDAVTKDTFVTMTQYVHVRGRSEPVFPQLMETSIKMAITLRGGVSIDLIYNTIFSKALCFAFCQFPSPIRTAICK